MNEEEKEKMQELMEKHNIKRLGGCQECQPNADFFENWGVIPKEIKNFLIKNGVKCCNNTPNYCEIHNNQ